MRDLLRRNPLAVVLAVVMHLAILVFLAVGVDWWRTPKPIASDVQVVQARLIESEPPAVPPASVKPEPVEPGPTQAELDALRAREEARQRAEIERRQQLAAEQDAKRRAEEEAARREAEQERRRLAELKKQQEAERRVKLEAEKRRQDQERLAAEKARAEKAKQEAERKRAELERQRKLDAEKKRKAEEARRRKAEAAAKAKAEAEARARSEAAARAAREADLATRLQAEEDARERNRVILAIQQKVERNWLRPPGTARGGLLCRVRVRLSSTGLVILASVVQSSGNSAFDRSVISAVEKAEPLPMPRSASLAAEFRDIVFEFAPSE